MLARMMKNDFLRKKAMTVTLFIFILLSSLLVSSGTKMIMDLTGSIHNLFTASKIPHFVQMHAGELNREQINNWAKGNEWVENHQVVEMINIDGSNLYLGAESEKNSIMDIGFVVQNQDFDFLLNLNSEVIQVRDGQVAVPVYYMQQNDLKIGDKIRIKDGGFSKELTISDFVRDAQMNPSIIHSKRFVVSESEFRSLKQNTGEAEYLIEFRLTDLGALSAFSNQYQASDLPKKGPMVDYSLFRMLNALTDGVVAAVIILVSLILNVIAILCIRFTMLATIEEDYREISVMKAIGISPKDIRKLYLSKYVMMAALASGAGYIGSFAVSRFFMSNMVLYMGTAPNSLLPSAVALLSVGIIFAVVVFFCIHVLRRFNKISAVEALRSGSLGDTKISRNRFSLFNNRWFSVPVFLGLKDVIGRFKMFRLLLFVFIVSSFIIIVPLNFLNTIQAPSFISYMGVGQSDIRIDLRHSDDVEDRFKQLVDHVKADADVTRFSPLVTSQFKVLNHEGTLDNLSVETGDFTIFPLDYTEGTAPRKGNELALSYKNSQEMDKRTGDSVILIVDGKEKRMKISGVYQDVTNGGKTAKAVLPYNKEAVLWYVVSLNVKAGTVITDKISAYEQAFYPAKVTDLQGYLHQTLGGTINQLKLVTILALVIALSVSILITFLFLKMLVAKDNSQIAILRSVGFALSGIRIQYVTISLIVLGAGLILGTLLSNTAGQLLIGGIMSFLGASNITFIIDPVQAYILSPVLLAVTVILTTLASIQSIKASSISKTIAE
ncbi:ABC transporter permease [Paenibacillus pinihumi]|uniref:ABC transporter permease n=1 Tax=Paenibacillus pinihumi TaxID=669462 RepID=UPI00048D40D6|nr:ABC transporter permease [Paenibacillus pinihumi]